MSQPQPDRAQSRAEAARALRSALDRTTDPDDRAQLIADLARLNGTLPPNLARERAAHIARAKQAASAAELGYRFDVHRSSIFRLLRLAATEGVTP